MKNSSENVNSKIIIAVSIVILIVGIAYGIVSSQSSVTSTSDPEPITVTDFKLNTYVSISGYSASATTDILTEALNLCDYYELMFSRTLKDSTLYKVNHHMITEIPVELATLIDYGIHYSQVSNGAFDLTIGSVSQLWDFTADNPTVPSAEDIANALQYVDYTKISLAPVGENSEMYNISIPEGTVIDLGAIAKGYIADRIKDFLLANGVDSAVINLGGNVLCVGSKPSGADFNIGIKKPFSNNEYISILESSDHSLVSSGTYERYFYQDGTFYHHILNPKTGYPYNSNLTGVTIISEDSVTGDCLSTTCFALGLDEGMALIEATDNVEAIFITADQELHYSSGINKQHNNDIGNYITIK